MKDKKKIVETFEFYDHTNIEKHLEKMAQRGWLLTKMNRFTWEYQRIEPKKLHFAVTYYPKASEFDPEPLEGQLIYRDYSERAGWKFVCSSAQMQVFYNEETDPIPMETDPIVEVDTIHKAAKRVYLPAQYLVLVLALLQAGLFVSSLLGNPIRVLASTTQLTTGFLWGLLLLQCITGIISYHCWHHKALKAAENGEFLYTRGRVMLQKLLLIAAVACGLFIFISLVSIGDRFLLTIYLILTAGLIALFVIVGNVKEGLKRKKASRSANLSITMIVDIVLAFVLVYGVTFGTLNVVQNRPYESVNILYQVEPPLVVEDLVNVSPDGYIKETRQNESVFLGQRALNQWPKRDGNAHTDVPGLRYTVTIVKVPAI